MRPLPFDASHYGAYFIYWGCRLKISIALNPKKNVTIVINSGQMSTSLRGVLQSPLFLSSTYIEMYHTSTILFGSKNHPCCRTKCDSRCTMVGSGFGPYHRLVHANAPTECAAVTPTTWAMSLTLGFGTILLGGK